MSGILEIVKNNLFAVVLCIIFIVWVIKTM